MTEQREKLYQERINRVVIIGSGMVGSTYAYTLLISGLVSEIIIIDVNEERAMGEVMDLNHGLPFVRPTIVRTGSYSDCATADLIVVTAGAAQKEGETRIDLVHKNTEIFKVIIPKIIQTGTDAVLLIATNPVDIMTYVTYKISGIPKQKVIGSGTVLDTARFRFLLSQHCRIDPANVHAYILGEHGDSELPVWSLANIAGLRFTEYCPVCGKNCGPVKRDRIFQEVRTAAYKIIKAKNATYYAIGLALVDITGSILRNEYSVLTVSTYLQGEYGLYDVCLSLPTVVARAGATKIIKLTLDEKEEEMLRHSADVLKKVIAETGI